MSTGAHQSCATLKGLLFGGVCHKGKIGHNQRTLIAPFYALGMVDHVIEANGNRAVVALQNITQGIAHQQHFYTGLAGNMGEGAVVSGEAGELLTFLFHFV